VFQKEPKDSDLDFAVITKKNNPKEDMAANLVCDKLSKKFNVS